MVGRKKKALKNDFRGFRKAKEKGRKIRPFFVVFCFYYLLLPMAINIVSKGKAMIIIPSSTRIS